MATQNGFNIYEGRGQQPWRWNLRRNGRIVADSGEGYVSRSNAERAVRRLMRWLADGAVVIHSDGKIIHLQVHRRPVLDRGPVRAGAVHGTLRRKK